VPGPAEVVELELGPGAVGLVLAAVRPGDRLVARLELTVVGIIWLMFLASGSRSAKRLAVRFT
jgi:hypothetical protein